MIFDKRTYRQAMLLLTGLSSSIAFSANQPNNFLHSLIDVKQYTPSLRAKEGRRPRRVVPDRPRFTESARRDNSMDPATFKRLLIEPE